MTKRVCAYLRVSTSRQAEKELSIPDQKRQAEEYCSEKGFQLVRIFEERGASATSENRPEFQTMIAEALSVERPFDVILVHSFSRFFRVAYYHEHYRRKLEKRGIEVTSITQDLGDQPQDMVLRQMIASIDEYQSAETAKHVRRSMKENARQGFWNGSHPPYGYKTQVVETRGGTEKKKLVIDDGEADVVRMIFELYLEGDGRGTLGIKAIADHLNTKGRCYRRGGKFRTSLVHKILSNEVYVGRHYYGKRNSKTGKVRPRNEWVEMATPSIIPLDRFTLAASRREKRKPMNTPPRVTSGPTLLAGLAKCGTCGGSLTIRTGKGGRYRYYTCAKAAHEGKSSCPGRSIRSEALDDLVLDQIEEKILRPGRLKKVMSALKERQGKSAEHSLREEKALRKGLRELDQKLDRLYDAVAEGRLRETSSLSSKAYQLETQKEALLHQIATMGRKKDFALAPVTDENIAAFSQKFRAALRDPQRAIGKEYLRGLISKIEVGDDEIRIHGSDKALLAGFAARKGNSLQSGEVPSSVQDWWARQDSNLQLRRYERRVLTN